MSITITFRDTKNLTLKDLLELFPNSKFANDIKTLINDYNLTINNHKKLAKLTGSIDPRGL